MKKKKKTLNVDKIIGLSAMFISLLTLVIFLYQTRVISRQARLSVTPRLTFTGGVSHGTSSVTFKLGVQNNGLGPAIIDSAAIFSNNKYYPLNFREFTKQNYSTIDTISSSVSIKLLPKGTAILPNNETVFVETVVPIQKLTSFYTLYDMKPEEGKLPFDIIIYYSSIYEEKWKITHNSLGHPMKQ